MLPDLRWRASTWACPKRVMTGIWTWAGPQAVANNRGDKIMTLVASALAGRRLHDDADALPAVGPLPGAVLGCVVTGPVHPGQAFQRSFPVGPPVRPAGPGAGSCWPGPGLPGPGIVDRRWSRPCGCRRGRPGLHHLREPTAWPGALPATTATPTGGGYLRNCWPWPPARRRVQCSSGCLEGLPNSRPGRHVVIS